TDARPSRIDMTRAAMPGSALGPDDRPVRVARFVRLDVGEHGCTVQLTSDVALQPLREVVALLDGPVAGDGQGQVYEPLAAGFAGSGRADPYCLAPSVAVEHVLDGDEVLGGERRVQQAAHGALHQRVAGTEDVDADEQ